MENTTSSIQSSQHSYIPVDVKFQKILHKYLVGIFVARKGGDILYSKSFRDDLKLPLMSNFIAALSMFGEENVGKIKRILIEGLDIEMNIVAKHGLILTLLFRPNTIKDHIMEFYETGLDMFYHDFQEQIDQNRTNLCIYERFEPKMNQLLYYYLVHINAI